MTNPLNSPYWRINNLYYITNKQGQRVLFKLNWAQQELYEEMWYCNIILKARQLGMSTFVCLLFLDRCLFNDNTSAGIIAHTLEDAQQMFRRVKFAYDNLPIEIRNALKAENDTSQMLKFSNGSSLRVGTSLRSSTFQFLHISEFGKVCCKYPEKATEIITGALNTVSAGQYVFIESTAEGREGYFYDMCKQAQSLKGKNLSKLDYKFFFFPWYKEPSYRIGSCSRIDEDMFAYFEALSNIGVKLDDEQKFWYASRWQTQQENMKREYPSTPEESWEQSTEGTYYAKQISKARCEGRIGFVPYDEQLLVHTSWDLGYNDSTAIWFTQIYRKEIRLIEYIEGSGESLAHWINIIKSKPYSYGKNIAPWDIMVHEYTSGMTRQSSARKLGVNFLPAQKVEIIPAIDTVRNMLNRCLIDEKKCSLGIKALENYKKEWDDHLGCWKARPLHDWSSHGADALRTLATGLNLIENVQVPVENNPTKYLNSRFG